jgi:hypothetical protein
MNIPTSETPGQRRLRKAGMFIGSIGLFAMCMGLAVGRPPIAREEAARHRLMLITLVAGGGLTAISGVVMVFFAQPPAQRRKRNDCEEGKAGSDGESDR